MRLEQLSTFFGDCVYMRYALTAMFCIKSRVHLLIGARAFWPKYVFFFENWPAFSILSTDHPLLSSKFPVSARIFYYYRIEPLNWESFYFVFNKFVMHAPQRHRTPSRMVYTMFVILMNQMWIWIFHCKFKWCECVSVSDVCECVCACDYCSTTPLCFQRTANLTLFTFK